MSDKPHFDNYREQTRVKHDILAAYLPAYFHILKSTNKNLLFIDGFAGKGTYTKADTGEAIDGSPLRALKLIAGKSDFAARVSTVFIEADFQLFHDLEKKVNDLYAKHSNIRRPRCIHGDFQSQISLILAEVQGNLAPTFLFVDPCGVKGASFKSIRDIMRCDQCESFIFFNIDGVKRIAGLDALSPVLIELMGSKPRAKSVYDELRLTQGDVAATREKIILEHYIRVLKQDADVKFVAPFRVEFLDKEKTSHFLIHATNHPLGFKIMKDVMWGRGHGADQPGGLELIQAGRTYSLFDDRGDAIKRDILAGLRTGPLKVAVFCEDWVCRPEDLRYGSAYKAALLELEARNEIEILDKAGKTPKPATARQRRNDKPTLGNDYFVQLCKPKRH